MHPRRLRLLLTSAVIASFAVTLALPDAPGADARHDSGSGSGRYIVTFNDQPASNAYAFVLAQSSEVRIDHQYARALYGFAGRMPVRFADALRGDPAVRSIEPDAVVRANVEALPTGIDRIDAEPPGGRGRRP